MKSLVPQSAALPLTLPAWPALDADALAARAAQAYGSEDFGDPGVVAALRRLVASLEASAGLSRLGRLLTRLDLQRLLGNALALQRAWTGSAQARAEAIEAPLVITGLPRSGSTFLQRLLAEDPGHRVLRHWEAARPAQPPRLAPWLRLLSHAELATARLLAPRIAAVHPLGVDTPQECTEILSNSLMSLRFDSTYEVPAYRAWLDADGSFAAFRQHRRALQLLQWRARRPGHAAPRWVLKSPDHIFTLPALFATYPDARLIITHRDPARVLPSVAHLTCLLHGMFSRNIEPLQLGSKVLERWAQGALLTSLAAATPQALSLAHEDIVRRPLDTVRTIYRHFGWTLGQAALRRMERFVRLHPRGDYGDNRYEATRYGLSDELLYDRFYLYNRRMSWHLRPVDADQGPP